ncbi:MAG: peptidyl-prolyl cis-trans isomerase, partial [Pseudomonadota bacterium]
FTIPERRRFGYAAIDRTAIADTVSVTDEEIAADYEANADLYAASERRRLRQVIAQNEAQAREFVARVRAGDAFETVAAELFELTAEDLDLGLVTKSEVADVANEAAADAAFAADNGVPTAPVPTDFGFNILVTDEIETVPGRPLEEVRDEIATALKAEKADEQLADLVGRAEDGFADGLSLAEVAEDLELTLERPSPLTTDGRTPDDPAFTLDEELQPILATVFEYSADEDPVAVELSPELFALVDTEEVLAPAPVPLDDIREQVTAQLRIERQVEAGNAMAEEIVAAVEAGSTLAAELRARDLPPVQDFTRRRVELAAAADQLPAGIMLGFVQPKGEIRAVPQPDRGAALIVETTDIVPGKIEDAPAFLTQVRTQMREAQGQELQLAYTNAITNHVGVTRYPNALSALEARYRGVELTTP